jgi:hypothetical protein
VKRVIACAAATLFAAAALGATAEVEENAELVLVVDAEYNLSHGWGHVFRCTVKKVVAGELPDEAVSVSVYGTVDLYGGLLAPFCRYENLIMGFARVPDRDYGPPPGFRDAEGTYWEVVFVREGPATDVCD